MPAVEQKITLQVLLHGPGTLRVTSFNEGSALESTVKPFRECPFHAGLAAERAQELLSLLARANAGARGLLPQLVSAGQGFYVDLLPAFLKDKLQRARDGNLVLHLDRELLGIPWELLHDGDAFLGRRFRMGRLMSTDQEGGVALKRDMRAPLSVLIVADPAGNLPAARREGEQLEAILADCPLFGQPTMLVGGVTARGFRDELGRHDVLHYAGHAEAGRPGEGGGRLLLKDGTLTTGMLAQLRGRADFPGLVFLNGCSSTDDTVRLSAGGNPLANVSGIASSLLLCGVKYVVGTLWEVRDEVASLSATSFYGELARGGTIGASLERSRAALIEAHGEDSLLWAAHLLYGDPTWRVAQPANAALDDFDTVAGLKQKYGRELLSEDAPTRLMAAAMLLGLGDRSVIAALGRDLETLLSWLAPDAGQRDRRLAGLVVQALATAAGLAPSGPPDQLPDAAAVRALYVRLLRG